YALAGSGTLMKLMGRSGFSITKVEKVTAGGEELTKIWFKVAPDEVSTKHTGAIPIEGGPGWLLLDPNCWWRIREFLMPFHSTKYDSRFNAVAKYSYEMADGGFPLVKQMDVTHSDLASGKPIGRAIREFTFEKRVASEDEFKLSAFGLPEPKITRPPSWWSYPVVWFSVIAFTCILLVFLIRWHKRRTAEPEGQPT
ncbi:MAG: DNA-directed RNA polymerase subunit omega, partial [Planctomycetes bacterium]|nr:DNA-directed RNA polymerase subunit omega [Planctomycetota bacterium]